MATTLAERMSKIQRLTHLGADRQGGGTEAPGKGHYFLNVGSPILGPLITSK